MWAFFRRVLLDGRRGGKTPSLPTNSPHTWNWLSPSTSPAGSGQTAPAGPRASPSGAPRRFDDRLSLGMMLNRTVATLSGGLGILAVLLTVIGIYGTMAFLGQQRRREIGVRLALGASRRGVVSLMTRHSTWAAGGITIGTAVGLAAALLLRSRLYGLSIADPVAFVVTPLALASAPYAASYLTARRAARLDPLVALREE
jgi:putative ABC transport system permease protein